MLRILAIAAMLATSGCAGPASDDRKASDSPPKPMLQAHEVRDLTAPEKAQLGKLLAQSLKDPDSAQWRWAKFPKNTDGNITYCAQVNAKNGYGGYNGYRSFIAMLAIHKGKFLSGAIAAIDDGQSSPGNPYTVDAMCRKEGLDPYAG